MPPYRRIDSGSDHALVNSENEHELQLHQFDPQFWGAAAKAVSGSGRGAAWFLETGSGAQWVLRHYRRGGLPGKLLKDAYLYTGENSVRSFNEFKLLCDLFRQGLPVPRPVAAHYHRRGLCYQANLIIERLNDTQALLTLSEPDHLPLWREAGRCIRRFHDAGVYHADLNATNILVNVGTRAVYLIDFDRGAQRAASADDTQWKRHNLERLERGVQKHWPVNAGSFEPFMEALKQGYR